MMKALGKWFLLTVLLISLYCSAIAQRTFYDSLADAALSLTNDQVEYDPSYFLIPYPNGDVPPNKECVPML